MAQICNNCGKVQCICYRKILHGMTKNQLIKIIKDSVTKDDLIKLLDGYEDINKILKGYF